MRELASRSNRLPVIFATAHGDIDMAVQALKDGASDFLPKPVKADRLIAAIEKAVKADLERRKAEWKPWMQPVESAFLNRYRAFVTSGVTGAVMKDGI